MHTCVQLLTRSMHLSAKRPTKLRSMATEQRTAHHRSTRMIFDTHLIKANELMFSVEFAARCSLWVRRRYSSGDNERKTNGNDFECGLRRVFFYCSSLISVYCSHFSSRKENLVICSSHFISFKFHRFSIRNY